MMRRVVVVLAAMATGLAGWAPATAQEDLPGAPDISAVAAVAVNLSEADAVVFQRAPRAIRAPASLTKLVTALVARDEYRLEEIVVTSPRVRQPHGSRLGLEPGMEVTVRDLLHALLLRSGNDAGTALAAHHPAGYDYFIELMNSKARSLGAYDSQFRNPHGLDAVGHYSSARDMAIFTREVYRDPVLAKVISTPQYTMPWPAGGTRSFQHHHKLVLDSPGSVGGKTGFTNNAGHTLSTVVRSEAGVVAVVVLGSADHYADTNALVGHARAVATHTAAGGGRMDIFGQLAPPPPAPDVGLTQPSEAATDPRDDDRWMAAVGVLALLTAGSLMWRRRETAPVDEVEAWLASVTLRQPAA